MRFPPGLGYNVDLGFRERIWGSEKGFGVQIRNLGFREGIWGSEKGFWDFKAEFGVQRMDLGVLKLDLGSREGNWGSEKGFWVLKRDLGVLKLGCSLALFGFWKQI